MKKKPLLLLINPWVYDFTAYDFWSKPLGLLYIAGVLREIGYDINLIDCMDRQETDNSHLKSNEDGRGPFYKEKMPKPDSLKHIPRNYYRYGIEENKFEDKLLNYPKPDAVLITSIMTYWYPGVFKAIEIIKKYYPDCPVILGGIYATLCYQHAINHSKADYVLKNSQLEQLIPLLQKITGCRENIISSEDIDFNYLESYPYPAWDLYQTLDYVCLITSRGCSNRCTYCASHILNSRLEFRNPEKVAEEVFYWKTLKGIDKFVFYDDALLENAERNFLPLLKIIKKKKQNINFFTPNAVHAKLITPLVAELMSQCGFRKIWLGFETSDPVLQKKTGNKVDNVSFINAIQTLLRGGFLPENIRVYLLIGLPGQSFQSIIDSVKLVIDNGVRPYLAKYSPIPETKMWKEIIKEYGWEEPVDPLLHNDALMPFYSPYINSEQYQQIKMLIQSYKL